MSAAFRKTPKGVFRFLRKGFGGGFDNVLTLYILIHMTTLNVRIDETLKKKATKTLAGLGLDMSGAIKLFLNQVVTENGLPFVPSRNAEKIREQWDREVAEALAHGKRYSSAKDLIDDILKNN